LVQLARWQERFDQLGVNVAGMTYDGISGLASFHAQQQLAFPLLRDVGAKHVNALGVRNQDYSVGHQAYGIPHPGILLIAPDGMLLAKFAEPGFKERPSFEHVYEEVEKIVQLR